MPIPVMPMEEASPAPQRALRLVAEPAAQPRPFLLYPRAIAHFVDFCVVQGTSVYSAKLFSILFLSFHARAIAHTGRAAAPLFREAFEYSSTQLLSASFAAIAMAYFVGLPLVTGRTLGLGLLGLRIRGRDGAPLTIRQLALRMAGCALAYGTFGMLCVVGLRQRDGRFLQDVMSETTVEKG